MPRDRDSDVQSLYEAQTTQFCVCMTIERRDGFVFGLTTLDDSLTINTVDYVPGLEIKGLESAATLDVNNTAMTIVQPDQALEADLIAGLWDNAAFHIFDYEYGAEMIADGLQRGTLGEVTVNQGSYVIELRGMGQALKQPVGSVTTKDCVAAFADYPRAVPGRLCRVVAATWTRTGTITTATSRWVVADAGNVEVDDFYGAGFLKFTDGLNAGYERQVRSYVAGVFTFVLPFPFQIDPGDAYSAIAGCRKRHERSLANPSGVSDCVDKFNNILNMQAQPHMQGVDILTKLPGVGS